MKLVMRFIKNSSFILLIIFISCSCFEFSISIDTITFVQIIKEPETIISNNGKFKFGFFSPENTTYRYVGIWYSLSAKTVIWVANRDNPIKDSSGIVAISEDGNLVVINEDKEMFWSSNVSVSVGNVSAQILDSGNLVMQEINNGTIIWESFEHPSDSFLPNMKLTSNVKTGEKTVLTSWKNPSDPSVGRFSVSLDALNIPEVFIWNDGRPHWRSGPWDNTVFIGIPSMISVYLDGFSIVNDKEGSVYLTFTFANKSFLSHFVMTSEGKLEQLYWDDGKEEFEINYLSPETECDLYGKCGLFGSCNMQNSPICSCLRGFEPKIKEEWNAGNWTNGCVRRTPLQCESANSKDEPKADGFLKLENMKVPDFAEWSSAIEGKCRNQCFENCSCIAYSYYTSIGCMWWGENLIDIQKFSSGGADLYIRVANSELDKKKDNKVLITVIVIMGSALIAICTYFSWRWLTRKRAFELLVNRGELSEKIDSINGVKLQELPIFSFENLAIATNNFDEASKLGQGGFGPVYKGKLQGGQEIAVKRLSKASGQGLEEFMNEVTVISKLQHRNLVRILGCCVKREEKILVYEYMPNKSLDAFLMDPLKQKLLDWRKRFNIIQGIGRGLLYLHRDSRLRIIHRDLKASNILLDEGLNPRISDFGMARIFRGNEDQANTLRVVGTYGYMSPEYAMEGRFSEKSDVFSYGVVLLEIISGRKNTSFYHDEQSLSLLGHTWKLWNDDNIVSLIDPVLISDPRFEIEIMRCVNVGLLCVQEYANDRPTMGAVISMLTSENTNLPRPKQPAFTERQIVLDGQSFGHTDKLCSINNVSVTVVQGR